MHKYIMPAIVLLLTLLLAIGNVPALAQTPTTTPTPAPTPAQAKVQGLITVVNTTANTVTITPQAQAGVTLTINANTLIKVWGKETATISDLKTNQNAQATYDPASLTAIKIEAKLEASVIPGTRAGYFGTIKDLSVTSITIDTKQGTFAFTISPDTQFWVPPLKDARITDVKVGDRISVLADGLGYNLLARRVLVIPQKPVHQQVHAVVTAISGTQVTLTYNSNQTVVADIPAGLARRLSVGDVITTSLIETPGTQKIQVKDLEKDDDVLARLNRAAEKGTGRKAEIDSLIARQGQKHIETLEGVLSRAPDAARPAIERELERSRQRGQPAAQPTPQSSPLPSPSATSTERGRAPEREGGPGNQGNQSNPSGKS